MNFGVDELHRLGRTEKDLSIPIVCTVLVLGLMGSAVYSIESARVPLILGGASLLIWIWGAVYAMEAAQ